MSRIDSGKLASDIIKEVTILKVIPWIQAAWNEVTSDTIKHCFEKCGFGTPEILAEENIDEEFDELLKELCPETSVEEFVDFDACVDICDPAVNTLSVDWRENLRAKCVQAAIDPSIESENSESEEDDDVFLDSEPTAAVTSEEALQMLDKLQLFFENNGSEIEVLNSVTSLTKTVEKIHIESKKQKKITDFFSV